VAAPKVEMVNAKRVWHKQGVMPPAHGQRAPRPLDKAKLDELALHYVSRFATSRGKLVSYLARKVRERGWIGELEPDLANVADKLVGLGYVDDAAFALSKARVLSGRGLGARRVKQALHAAGISEDDGAGAADLAQEERVAAALRLARRRRIGPFAPAAADPAQQEKALAAMIRAGHSFALSRAIVSLRPGADIDEAALQEVR
jgi:regulatory protein